MVAACAQSGTADIGNTASRKPSPIFSPMFAGGSVLRISKLIYSQFPENSAQPSSDGTRLALESGHSGTNQIWLNSTEGDRPVQLTNIGQHSGTPRWSSDGGWIAFDTHEENHS